jgi:hypothetical protein
MKVFTLLMLSLAVSFSSAWTQDEPVDFRYSPSRYFAAICFPNDWLKTVVTENNGLGYDFGPGPYASPLTEITVRPAGENVTLTGHHLPDPKIPLIRASFQGAGSTMVQEAFAVPLGTKGASRTHPKRDAERLQGWNGTVGWARPEGQADSAFRNAAWGVNRPILYRVPVRRGSEKLVALGICEPYKWGPGTRILELRVEGAEPVIFDPLETGKKNEPHVLFFRGRDANGDGRLAIEAHAALASPDPNPFLNVFWVFPPEATVNAQDLITGRATRDAELYFDCGLEEERWQNELRADALITSFQGNRATPEIIVRSTRSLVFDSSSGMLLSDGKPFVVSRPRALNASLRENGWHILLPAGTTHLETFALHGPWTKESVRLLPDGERTKASVVRFWQNEARLPQSRMIVPDSGIQYLLDANIRNLYQIGELVDGRQQFNPGPSVYRGLWVHDAVWHISALLYLGDATSARLALENLLRYQLPTGQIKVMAPHVMNRETPIVAYTMFRFARMTGDREWLASHWNSFERALSWIEERRRETLMDPASPGYGLFPPGFADGGLGGVGYEYASAYWGLIGFRAGVDAAIWMGKPAVAQRCQTQYDELMRSFRQAARRDMRMNEAGHWYLPLRVADTSGHVPPQQANWPLFDAQGIAHLFDPRDTLVTGTLAMLDDSTKEGLPTNTGWLKDGLWPFFGSLEGITHTYQRDYAAAHRLLYAVANHASALGTWVEEQLPRSVGQKTSGDGSNATASALFIKQVRRLLMIERGDTLELLAGIPDSWCKPGATIAVNGCLTSFGNVRLTLSISGDGRRATAIVGGIGKAGDPGCSTLDMRGLRRAGFLSADGSPLPDCFTIEHGRSFRLSMGKK